MSIFEAAFLLGLAPKDFVVAIRVEGRVDVNQIDARGWELSQLIEIIAAVDDARIDESRDLCRHFCELLPQYRQSRHSEGHLFKSKGGLKAFDIGGCIRNQLASVGVGPYDYFAAAGLDMSQLKSIEGMKQMKPKFVVALVILGAILVGMEPLTAQTTPPPLVGSWQLSLIPGNPNPTVANPAIQALATFTQDGSTIETDSSELISISPTARGAGQAATSGHGIWQPAPAAGNLFIRFIKLIVNPNGTLYARKTVTITGALDSTGDNFSGGYSFVLVDPNGGFLGTGFGTVSGQRIPHPLLP